MQMALKFPDATLAGITKCRTLGPFLNRLAKVDPARMETYLRKATTVVKASKKNIAEAQAAKRTKRKSDSDNRSAKRAKYNAPPPEHDSEQELDDSRSFSSRVSCIWRYLHPRQLTRLKATSRHPTSVRAMLTGPPEFEMFNGRIEELEMEPEAGPADSDVGNTNNASPPYLRSRRYEQEVGISKGSPAVVEPHVEICLQKFQDAGTSKKAKEHLAAVVFGRCEQLDFATTRFSLWRFLCTRKEALRGAIEVRACSKLEDVVQALDTLQSLDDCNFDLRIRQIFTQMRLYTLVQEAIKSTSVTHVVYLERLAKQKAVAHEGERETLRREKKYIAWYATGKRWHDISSWFGGDAIVLVFVLAGTLE